VTEPIDWTVLPEQSGDDTGEAWGERRSDAADLERYLYERPPHHGD
jgi:hypothetical protein